MFFGAVVNVISSPPPRPAPHLSWRFQVTKFSVLVLSWYFAESAYQIKSFLAGSSGSFNYRAIASASRDKFISAFPPWSSFSSSSLVLLLLLSLQALYCTWMKRIGTLALFKVSRARLSVFSHAAQRWGICLSNRWFTVLLFRASSELLL